MFMRMQKHDIVLGIPPNARIGLLSARMFTGRYMASPKATLILGFSFTSAPGDRTGDFPSVVYESQGANHLANLDWFDTEEIV